MATLVLSDARLDTEMTGGTTLREYYTRQFRIREGGAEGTLIDGRIFRAGFFADPASDPSGYATWFSFLDGVSAGMVAYSPEGFAAWSKLRSGDAEATELWRMRYAEARGVPYVPKTVTTAATSTTSATPQTTTQTLNYSLRTSQTQPSVAPGSIAEWLILRGFDLSPLSRSQLSYLSGPIFTTATGQVDPIANLAQYMAALKGVGGFNLSQLSPSENSFLRSLIDAAGYELGSLPGSNRLNTTSGTGGIMDLAVNPNAHDTTLAKTLTGGSDAVYVPSGYARSAITTDIPIQEIIRRENATVDAVVGTPGEDSRSFDPAATQQIVAPNRSLFFVAAAAAGFFLLRRRG